MRRWSLTVTVAYGMLCRNLFWRQGRDVFTPRLDYAGVNGIMRQRCIAQLAPSTFRVVEVTARPETLRRPMKC